MASMARDAMVPRTQYTANKPAAFAMPDCHDLELRGNNMGENS
jgi:hypothetical protein